MSTTDDHIAQFDAYLRDELSDQERADFERRLEDDPVLKSDFVVHKQEVTLIRSIGIRQEMSQVMADEKSGKPVIRYWLPLAVAAVLALVLLALPKRAIESKLLFEEVFEPYPNAISGRNQRTLLMEAMAKYDAQDFASAIAAFDELAPNDTITFYRAMSYLGLSKPESALQDLDGISESSMFAPFVPWYKGLAFLLLDQKDSARYYLNQSEVYPEKLQRVLDQLRTP